MLRQDRFELLEIVKSIAVRHSDPSGSDGWARMTGLLVALKGVVWRTASYSKVSAGNTWNYIQSQAIDMEWLIQMAHEFAFLVDWEDIKDDLGVHIAESLAWPQVGGSLPSEIRNLTAASDNYADIFSSNCWLTFLYLLQMSNTIMSVPDYRVSKRAGNGKS